jgi:hypothetical protein
MIPTAVGCRLKISQPTASRAAQSGQLLTAKRAGTFGMRCWDRGVWSLTLRWLYPFQDPAGPRTRIRDLTTPPPILRSQF